MGEDSVVCDSSVDLVVCRNISMVAKYQACILRKYYNMYLFNLQC